MEKEICSVCGKTEEEHETKGMHVSDFEILRTLEHELEEGKEAGKLSPEQYAEISKSLKMIFHNFRAKEYTFLVELDENVSVKVNARNESDAADRAISELAGLVNNYILGETKDPEVTRLDPLP